MSRIAKAPVDVVSGVEVSISGQEVTVKGSKGTLTRVFNDAVEVAQEENQLKALPREGFVTVGHRQVLRALSLTQWFKVFQKVLRKTSVVRCWLPCTAQGNKLNLTLGFSHPVAYEMPEGITVETPSQTEIVVKGADKQVVGQVAANIRGYRPPEPYKGKGVRYADEHVRRKEAKKK